MNDEYARKNMESLNGINSRIFDTQMHSSGSMDVYRFGCDDDGSCQTTLFGSLFRNFFFYLSFVIANFVASLK